jgi:hypothetical protein
MMECTSSAPCTLARHQVINNNELQYNIVPQYVAHIEFSTWHCWWVVRTIGNCNGRGIAARLNSDMTQAGTALYQSKPEANAWEVSTAQL